MKYTRIPETAFQKLQLNAGMILTAFDPKTATIAEDSILGATSGGVNFTATPTYSDFGEGIDNCPVNVMELKRLDSWDVKMSGNFITIDSNSVLRSIGAADIDKTDSTKIVPRNDLKTTDFDDLWWVGDYSDKNGVTNGGFVAIHMLNALSTGGFQVQSGNREKGQFAFEFTGHYSINDQSKVPFEVYINAGTEETA